MTGILPDTMQIPAAPADVSVIDPADPVARSIKLQQQQSTLEQQRAELSQVLCTFLRDEINSETERAFGTENTRATYGSDFKRFKEFCITNGLAWLPTSPEAIAAFIIHRAAEGARPKALERSVAAIKFIHQLSDSSWSFDEVMIRAALRWVRERWAEEDATANAGSTQSH